MKVLYISNIAGIAGQRMSYNFCGSAIKASHELQYEFICAANRSASSSEEIKKDEKKYNVKLINIDIARSPLAFRQNHRAYKQLVRVINNEKIDYIHCNTPMGGVLGRLAGKKCGVEKVIYQAHGFHFYKGAPLKNWLFYYPVEKILAHWTDAIITINKEDFLLAKEKLKLRKGGKVYYIPGVGIDLSIYKNLPDCRTKIRKEIGIAENDIMFVSAGRLDINKNNAVIIHAISQIDDKVQFVLCGDGEEREYLKELACSLGVEKKIHFLGNRADMVEIYNAADIFVNSSYREGLSRSIMEAMASGLPVLCSNIRGNTDLVNSEKGGFLFEPDNVNDVVNKMKQILSSDLKKIGLYNRNYVENFSLDKVTKEIKKIYEVEFEC